MTDSNAKGDAAERELLNGLADCGWTAMRAPASGSATDRDLPDVLAGRDGRFLAIEVKASSSDTVYVDEAEVEALRRFAEDFGADARLAFRFNEKHGDPTYGTDRFGTYLFPPERCYRTDGGNYRMKKPFALQNGTLYSAI